MGSIIDRIDAWIVALGFAVAMLAVWGVGWRRARRTVEPVQDPGSKFADASIALLGLLLGFTFAMSLTRHDQRKSMVVAESNAIGDFYTCASLLKEPHRSKLQRVIQEYAEQKLALARDGSTEADLEKAIARFQNAHSRMTTLSADAIDDGTPIAVSLTNTLNGVTSNHTSRLAAYRDRLPWIIVLLLFLSAIVPAFLMGQQQAASQVVHLSGTLCFMVLVTAVIYVILDLNQPNIGTITVSQEPIERLIQSMSK